MSAAGNAELGGFERRLLIELRAVVTEHAAERSVRQVSRPVSRWSLAAGVAVAAGACVAVLIALSAGSAPSLAQAFPILRRPGTSIPATLASFLRSGGVSAQHARLDVRHARRFRTPLGTGYVLTDRAAEVMCVAAPGFDHNWAASCGNAAAARRQGVGDLETFGPRGASVEDVVRMRDVCRRTEGWLGVEERVQVKASGGIRTWEQAMAMLEAGATRLGTSAGVAIMQEARERIAAVKDA